MGPVLTSPFDLFQRITCEREREAGGASDPAGPAGLPQTETIDLFAAMRAAVRKLDEADLAPRRPLIVCKRECPELHARLSEMPNPDPGYMLIDEWPMIPLSDRPAYKRILAEHADRVGKALEERFLRAARGLPY